MKFRHLATAITGAALAFAVALPAMASPTGGAGGALTDRVDQSFSANGITSTYHIFAEGLDTSKEVGLLLYMDGSGGFGIDNENSSYLIDADGTAGLRQVARDNNMLLLTPLAPGPGCDGEDNCWYNESTSPNATQKADWLRALVDRVYSQYNIEKDRVAIGGYSSGAQATTRWFVPRHGAAIQTDGVFVAIAFGGAPAASAGTPNFPQSYKDKVVGYWNTGQNDNTGAYSTAAYGAIGGKNWYRDNGFQYFFDWPAGVGHNRSDFAVIMRKQIADHVRAAQPIGSTPTEPTPAPQPSTDYATTVNATEAGVTFTVQVPAGATEDTYVRVTNGSRSTYLYTSEQPVADVTFTSLGTDGAEWSYAVYSGSSTSQTPEASGKFRTWSSAPALIPGDRNGDGVVNVEDVRALSTERGTSDPELAEIAQNWTA